MRWRMYPGADSDWSCPTQKIGIYFLVQSSSTALVIG